MLIIILICFAVCFLVEKTTPGWKLPQIPTWTIRVLAINFAQLLIIIVAGYSWEKWLSAYSLFHLSNHVTNWLGGIIAYLSPLLFFIGGTAGVTKVIFYGAIFTKIHHSAQRIEVITSFYKHPLEMTVNSIIGSLLVYTLLGLNPEAGAIYTLCTALGEFFYHTNIKTPKWIGYIFQRPEIHRIHHEYEKHVNNYGDIVWWDMLFGTYSNPKEFTTSCGFDTEKELKLADMLGFKDVHKTPTINSKKIVQNRT